MTNKYSKSSADKLASCHEDLQLVFNLVLQHIDTTVIEGHRPESRQNELYRTGKSQLQWPEGKHNSTPSLAIDVAPYPINWKDRERFTLYAGFVLGIAASKGIKLRWGGDWDMDNQVADNNFDDLVHFELAD